VCVCVSDCVGGRECCCLLLLKQSSLSVTVVSPRSVHEDEHISDQDTEVESKVVGLENERTKTKVTSPVKKKNHSFVLQWFSGQNTRTFLKGKPL